MLVIANSTTTTGSDSTATNAAATASANAVAANPARFAAPAPATQSKARKELDDLDRLLLSAKPKSSAKAETLALRAVLNNEKVKKFCAYLKYQEARRVDDFDIDTAHSSSPRKDRMIEGALLAGFGATLPGMAVALGGAISLQVGDAILGSQLLQGGHSPAVNAIFVGAAVLIAPIGAIVGYIKGHQKGAKEAANIRRSIYDVVPVAPLYGEWHLCMTPWGPYKGKEVQSGFVIDFLTKDDVRNLKIADIEAGIKMRVDAIKLPQSTTEQSVPASNENT